ncbi:hypothetical protein [Tabrizicola sp.]|uniref:hypothetical protein n=1 Tax=Tabrizicola sp. TaxID=2005166 RepID=UPI003F3AD5F0
MIADMSSASPLTALLREVNETVLGRSLLFETGGGASLTLDVAGRRVLRLTAVSGLGNAEACLGAEALEDEHKDDLIKLFQALALPRQELRVVSGPMSRGGEGMSVGLPVALLADLLLIELNGIGAEPAQEPEPEPEAEMPEAAEVPAGADGFLTAFAGAMGSGVMAWLIVGGASDGATFGPDDMVSHLNGFLDDEGEALGRQLDQMADTPEGPVCLVLGSALSEGHSILVVRAEGGVLLGVTEGDATAPVLSAWNTVRA